MIFRTKINLPVKCKEITYNNPLYFVGSCFSQHMGSRFEEDRFNVLINPFGTIYNPISIAKALSQGGLVPKAHFVNRADRWYHLDYHSDIYANDISQFMEKLNAIRKQSRRHLALASHVFITLGSAFVFEYKKTQKIVSNCHKQPANLFTRRLLELTEVEQALRDVCQHIFELNPTAAIVFTISPIRHVRDGLVQNSISKATLRLATSRIMAQYDQVSYFPSYEIMMDDLRDYRFYDEKLVQPNTMAQQYIYECLESTFLSNDTSAIQHQVRQVKKAAAHRPYHAESDQHQQFLQKHIYRAKQLTKQYNIDLTATISALQQQLVQRDNT